MKKLLIIFIGLFFAALWGNVGLCQDGKGPGIKIEEPEFDFKEVKEGTILEHAFKIVNTGSEPLQIISVKPG